MQSKKSCALAVHVHLHHMFKCQARVQYKPLPGHQSDLMNCCIQSKVVPPRSPLSHQHHTMVFPGCEKGRPCLSERTARLVCKFDA